MVQSHNWNINTRVKQWSWKGVFLLKTACFSGGTRATIICWFWLHIIVTRARRWQSSMLVMAWNLKSVWHDGNMFSLLHRPQHDSCYCWPLPHWWMSVRDLANKWITKNRELLMHWGKILFFHRTKVEKFHFFSLPNIQVLNTHSKASCWKNKNIPPT